MNKMMAVKWKWVQNMGKVAGLNYNRRYIVTNAKSMDEVVAWIGQQSPLAGYEDDFSYFLLDKEATQAMRFNSQERVIEFSEGVDEFHVKGVEHILNTEHRSF